MIPAYLAFGLAVLALLMALLSLGVTLGDVHKMNRREQQYWIGIGCNDREDGLASRRELASSRRMRKYYDMGFEN